MLSLALLVVTCVAPAPQVTRLNPRFDLEDVVGGVRDYALHPSGAEVLFRVDARNQGSLELYRAPLDGSRRPLPVVPMAPGRSVEHYAFSADGQWLVFTGDKDREGDVGLYSHRVGTVGSVRLDRGDADVTFGEQTPFLVVGNRVVYTTVGTGITGGVYTVPLDGSAPALALYEGWVSLLGASASAGRAYFEVSDLLTTGVYSVPVNGSGSLRFLAEGSPDQLQLDPSGTRAFFRRRLSNSFERELVTVPLDGSTPALVLAISLPPYDGRFFLSDDGSRVVFDRETGMNRQICSLAADGSGSLITLGNSTPATRLVAARGDRAYFAQATTSGTGVDLLSAPMDGSAAPRMLAPNSFAPTDLRLSADGQWVVFHHSSGPLYTVRADGGAPPVLLESNAVAFELSPASDRVLYSTYAGLRSAPIDGSAAAVGLPGFARAFGFTPGGEHGLAISAVGGPDELYRVEPAGLQRVRLSRELARGTFSDVQDFRVSATAGAVFRADALRVGDIELYAAAADGSATPVLLTNPGQVTGFTLSADGAFAAYLRKPHGGAGPAQVYAVPTDGSRPPLRLNPPLEVTYDVTEVQVTADSTRATFLIGINYGWGGPRPRDLWIAPLDGSAPASLLASNVTSYVLSPDSRGALFYEYSSSAYHFRRVPLDGSEAPLSLADYDSHSFLPSLTFTPDGSRAVVVAYPNNAYVFTAAMQGPADVRVLLVASFAGATAVTAAGRLVFCAPLAGDTQMTLHSLALDGSDPRRISSGTSWVGAFHLTADGTTVVYTDQGQLFRAAVDGSSAPVSLSGAIPGPTFGALSPDETRLVFVSTSTSELFSAPFDGSAAPLRISRTGGGGYGASVKLPLFVTPDSRVLYAADHDATGAFDLWLAPVDGSSAALRLSPPLAPPGVVDYHLAPDGQRALYLAAERPFVVELVTVPFPDLPQDRHLLPR